MSDIIKELREIATHDAEPWIRRIAAEAADEIERLRSLVGAVSPGETLSEIKEMLRTPEGIARLRDSLPNG